MPIFDCPFEIVLVIPDPISSEVYCTLIHNDTAIPFDCQEETS